MKLRTRISLATIALIALAGIVIGATVSQQVRYSIVDDQRHWAATLAKTVAKAVFQDTLDGDKRSVRRVLKRIIQDNADIAYLLVVDFNGEPFAHTFDGDLPEPLLNFSNGGSLTGDERVVMIDGKPIDNIAYPLIEHLDGRVHIGISRASLTQAITNVRSVILLVVAFVTLGGVGLAFWIAGRITWPIVRLSDSLKAFGQGELETLPSPREAGGELRQLAESFSSMVSQRTAAERALRRNEGLLAEAQEVAHLGNWELEIETGKAFWSEEQYRLLGYRRQDVEATQENFMAAVHPDDRGVVRAAMQAALDPGNGRSFVVEHRVVTAEGGERVLQQNGRVSFDGQGRPLRMFGTSLDITARKHAELELRALNATLEQRVKERTEALAAAKERAEHYLNIAGSIIVALDDRGRVILINKKGSEVLGYDREEIIGRDWFDTVIPAEDREAVRHVFSEVLTGHMENTEQFENRVLTRSGEQRLVAWHNSMLRDEAGAVVGCLSSGEDVTEDRKIQEALRASKEEAEKANLAKSQFLSNMSHELRTPLNSVLGFAQLLEMDDADRTAELHKEYVDYILKGGRYLLELINEILDLSKIEAGEMRLSVEPLLPGEVLMGCVDLVRPLVDKAGVQPIRYRYSGALPEVLADFTRLRQALINLLSNAVKYNRPNGLVTITAEKLDDRWLRLAVADTGSAFPSPPSHSFSNPSIGSLHPTAASKGRASVLH